MEPGAKSSPALPSPGAAPPRLRLRATAAAEEAIRAGHPWLYADSVREQNRDGQLGEYAILYDRRDRFLAIGLFDPLSPIRVRVLHTGQPVTLDDAWWCQHLDRALERRRELPGDGTDGYRWVHGENDGWPGLVLDRYGSVLVLKLYTAAWLARVADLTRWICDRLKPAHLVLRLSRNTLEVARHSFALQDGQVLWGKPLQGCAVFSESGLRFEADVLRGQKTGFFLDQRENRRRVEALAAGRSVLNAFSFSGGFSLYAARGGATAVTDLDISAHALAAGDRNFALNQAEPAVSRCPRRTLQGDAFEWLRRNAAPAFDLVILDPPSLAKRETERATAIRAYERLASDGIRALNRSGILVSASCSAHVSSDEFFSAVRSAARASRRPFEELATTGHPADHAPSFPEAHYLKCIYLRFA